MSQEDVETGEAGGIYRGHDGLRRLFRDWHEAWKEIEYDYEELIDGGEYVISVVTRRARGRASGAPVERPFALVWTIKKGKVTSARAMRRSFATGTASAHSPISASSA